MYQASNLSPAFWTTLEPTVIGWVSQVLDAEGELRAQRLPWLEWLSGLSAGLRAKGSPVRFPV